jgi:hypothetical protein
MISRNILQNLYESGITPRNLLHLYVNEGHEQVWDEGVQEMYERKVLNALISGEYFGLGYSSDSNGALVVIQPHQWRFLDPDIYGGEAAGEGIRYDGIKCIKQDTLSDKDKKLLEGVISPPQSSSSQEESRTITPLSFEAIGAIAWNEVTIRLLKNDFAEVCGPKKSLLVSLDTLGLMNKTEQKTNNAFENLLSVSIGPYTNPSRKGGISKLRRTLQKRLCTDKNPIPLQGRAYSLAFTLVDDRNAADKRADAKREPYDDNILYESAAPQDSRIFENRDEEEDDQDKWGQD